MSEYDKELIRAIQAQWLSLLEEAKESLGVGMVNVTFLLHADGAIDSPTITDSTIQPPAVDLAVRAVTESAPFGPWPEKLAKRTGGASREIRITFHYQ
jgi:outer membrane biosynthesis protein TonB